MYPVRTFRGCPPGLGVPEPCEHCGFCRWDSECKDQWDATEHLSLVAGVSRGQRAKLRDAGIVSLRALAQAVQGPADLQAASFERLRAQARLQLTRQENGDSTVEVLPRQPGRGFDRLPRPDPGDMFFDMEGDPLFEGGLEYLFGIVTASPEATQFTVFGVAQGVFALGVTAAWHSGSPLCNGLVWLIRGWQRAHSPRRISR
jgi:uncharacterized protein